MQTIQALVLVGGKAYRLKAGGISVPSTKSFMQIAGQPIFYWCLLGLHQSGIRKLVIAADSVYLLQYAARIIRHHPCRFTHVDYFRDEGNGVHGIPYEARYLLDETYLVECGHAINTPAHYKRLICAKKGNATVFSAYTAHPSNARQPVALSGGRVVGLSAGSTWAIAHPLIADHSYASSLQAHRFAIHHIIEYCAARGSLHYVHNPMPPEYDTPEEYAAIQSIYRHYVAISATIRK